MSCIIFQNELCDGRVAAAGGLAFLHVWLAAIKVDIESTSDSA